MTPLTLSQHERALGHALFDAAIGPHVPTMREFAESTIVIPTGKYKDQPFSTEIQPFMGLFFDELERNHWPRVAAVGPQQTGKTLLCFAIPVCYHAFAVSETVVVGLPDMNMAQDKWEEDLRPVIEAAPGLRGLLPMRGEGSQRGKIKTRITFRNGATLRFMSAGGRDAGRGGFNSRVLAVTEADQVAIVGQTSEETDKLSQMEGRLRSYDTFERSVYIEGTCTVREGRIWQEVTHGTDSRIVLPCPHCGAWVTLERGDLKGWQTAETERQAYDRAHFACSACGEPWTEQERAEANTRGVLAHRGQEVTEDGRVVGPIPEVITFGFRWSAINNLLVSAGEIGLREWRARRSPDRENAERELCQYVWAIPYEPPEVELTPLDPDELRKRTDRFKRGVVPRTCTGISIGVDTGKRRLHWVAIAWRNDGTGYVIDYGEWPVDWQAMGTRKGLAEALRTLATYWVWRTEDGREARPGQVWVDARYHEHTEGVYDFCTAVNAGLDAGQHWCRPCMGFGVGQQFMTPYHAPKQIDKVIRYIGEQYDLAWKPAARLLVVRINADHWKTRAHEALAKPVTEPGALVLFEGMPGEHDDYIDQVTAEVQRAEWVKGKGERIRWESIRRKNHQLDATYQACAAGRHVLAMAAGPKQETTKWWTKRKR